MRMRMRMGPRRHKYSVVVRDGMITEMGRT
jgi:peroxiredoxin